MFIIPYRVEVSIRRWPAANLIILGLLLLGYLIELAEVPNHIERIVPFVLAGSNPLGLVGYLFLHDGLVHLGGNMLFLWVFGNAVCVRAGNLAYLFIFLGLGTAAGLVHLSFSGAPAIGASGAINGIVGMFLAWFPANYLSVFWVLGLRTLRVRSYWMILLWLAFDVLGASSGWGGAAYWAHLGGFAAGFGSGLFLLKLGLIQMEPHEKSLLQLLGLQKDPDEELGPVAPRMAMAARLRAAGPMSLAPPEGYFVSFPCTCGVELRAPRKRAGEEFTCLRCSARTKIPAE